MSEGIRTVELTRVSGGGTTRRQDDAACEEPLELRVQGDPFAVIMRTPGADLELAAGFLLAERVVLTGDDLGTIEHCTRERDPHRRNVVNVTLTERARLALRSERRRTLLNASCGLCGRATIDSLLIEAPPLPVEWSLPAQVISALPRALRPAQDTFGRTGGLHAAGLFTREGELETVAEDVGRHNAVDKVVGRALLADRLPLRDRVLFVSGRTSFEIVQKALLAGIPVLAAVSAPSSLAIELAHDSGITLIGFVRETTFNIYAHPERIESPRTGDPAPGA